MGMVSQSGSDEAALGLEDRERRRGAHTPRHAAGAADTVPPSEDEAAPPDPVNPVVKAYRVVRDYLPRGNTLDEATFQRRHLILCWILALHVPVLWVFGVWRGYGAAHVTLEVSLALASVAFARMAKNRRLASFFTTFGLVYCSSILVHFSGGQIEAHFHFFVLIGLIALYQDWVPLLWNVLFTLLSHGLGSALASGLIFNHEYGQNKPWLWAALHAGAVLAASAGVVVFWKNTELEQERNMALVEHLAAVEVERKEAMSGLLVNLARRNQSLLNRQLEVISDLELREQQADVLEELFRLDHLATRIRRNAESLLVLSGDDPPRRWGNPVPLGDVVRAAAAEIEDYRRVEVLVNDHIDVAGRAVADLAHLLAELIENAVTFSPPSSEVRIRSHLSPGETTRFVVAIEDVGIGMSNNDLQAANLVLSDAPQVDMRRATMLGFHVVARLAQRYDIQVRLAATPGGGLTALVSLPRELVSDRPADAPPPGTSGLAGLDRYHRAALAWSGDGHRPSLAGSIGPWAAQVPPDADAAAASSAAAAAAASAASTSPAASGSPAGSAAAAAAASGSALPERYPPAPTPAWLTTPMPAWYQPAIPAQSAPLDAGAPFDTTSPFGATIPLGSQPARLDARSVPLNPAIQVGFQPEVPGLFSPASDPAIPAGYHSDVPGTRPTPADSAISLTPRPARLDASGRLTPTAPLDPATPLGTGGPFNPAAPLDPAARSDAAAQPGSAGTFDPAAPLDPATPLGSAGTFDPAAPLDPAAPSDATAPLGSGAPLDPAIPHDAPAASADAAQPAAAASEPSRVVPLASGAGAQVHPGSRLGPVAAFIELQLSSAPASPAPAPAPAPAAPVPPRGLVERASVWPTAAAGPPPLDVASTPLPPATEVESDPDGLARRVPGTNLPPALRRDAPGPPADAEGGRDADQVRAMLSRFQASQNAGRVAADTPRPRPPEENR